MQDWTVQRAGACAAAAPCLAPRERPLGAATKRALIRWARRELGVRGPLWVSEWVSMDSRRAPHELRIRWLVDGAEQSALRYAKSEDVLAAPSGGRGK